MAPQSSNRIICRRVADEYVIYRAKTNQGLFLNASEADDLSLTLRTLLGSGPHPVALDLEGHEKPAELSRAITGSRVDKKFKIGPLQGDLFNG